MSSQCLAPCAQRPHFACYFRVAILFALFLAVDVAFHPVTLWAASAADAQPLCDAPQTLMALADAWLEQDAPSANHGSDAMLFVKTHGSIKWRTLVRFALPVVPAGCVVESASLRLHAAAWSEGRTLEAVGLASDWSEELVIWGNQPATSGEAATTSSSSTVAWDVTSQVQAMLAARTHYGFQIRDALEGNADEERPGFAQQFHSREQLENRPQLVIAFMPAPDTTAPETTLESGPSASTTDAEATFTFAASEAGSTFECALDGTAFTLCTAPVVYTGLTVGPHSFAVRATDAAGNVDETPASSTWTVEQPAEVSAPETQQPDDSQSGDDTSEPGAPQTGDDGQSGDDTSEPGAPQTGGDPADTTPTLDPGQEPPSLLFLPQTNR